MPRLSFVLRPSGEIALRGVRLGCATAIFAPAGIYLTIGIGALAGWRFTGRFALVSEFFTIPGALLTIWLAAIELALCLYVSRYFEADEPLHRAWLLIAGSALFGLIGALCSQVLGVDSGLNFLRALFPSSPDSLTVQLRAAGLALGGTFRFAFLAGGLYGVLQVYRRAGFPGRLSVLHWVVLTMMAAFVGRNIADVVAAVQHGKHPGFWEVLGWPVDPILIVLLAEAFLLYSAMGRMGNGWIGRCWRAFAVGVFLVALGDVGLWATNYGYLPWPWSALTWYLWIPASTCFALGPVYQLEAIHHALRTASQPAS